MMGEYSKAWVALIMAIIVLIELYFGWTFGLTEEWIVGLVTLLTPIFVWLVPNRP
jgi:thiamine transporter ThiT